MARDPLYDNLAQGQHYQQSTKPIITGLRATDASPYHFHEAAFDSPTWGRPARLSYEPPSSMLARDGRLHQLRELTQDTEVFNPDSPGSNIELYLKDVNYSLSYIPEANMADKLLLLRKTTSHSVHGFWEWQHPAVAENYYELFRALRAEYTMYQNPSASCLSALQIRQNHYETQREYYECLHRVYFAGTDSPREEEDIMFKSLFISNLHPAIKKLLSLGSS